MPEDAPPNIGALRGRPRAWRRAGTGGCRPNCTVGRRPIATAGLMICSISCADPALLIMAWDRVAGNKGARTAGVDGATAAVDRVPARRGRFPGRSAGAAEGPQRSSRCRCGNVMIPKAGGKVRRLGIPTVADRVVQAALKLVLEPIFEADFEPSPTGSARSGEHTTRSRRSTSSPPTAMSGCLRPISRRVSTRSTTPALMGRVRRRVKDKRVLALVKAFLKAGILTELGDLQGHHYRHPARRHLVAAAGQHRLVGAR